MIERLIRLASSRLNPWASTTGATKLRLPTYSVGAPNLEILKFGIYIMFPIGWMYYFGTNLENRFSVPDFWPKPEEVNKIPFEKSEQKELAGKLAAARLERRRKRLELEERMASSDSQVGAMGANATAAQDLVALSPEPTTEARRNRPRLGMIDRWASGKEDTAD